ncbi:hypothetical protein FA95DRAFT_1537848 [Auriscalpium vulgare]|uniref:Uncharacterized protein n=1 Tax=Auriscalpium vulgare TaxID=40419 RepID=A0ACB8S155_9AGAM|nr:hypothetical protein FA95DRAFT_1537848 [Auriscalpium vulgare]
MPKEGRHESPSTTTHMADVASTTPIEPDVSDTAIDDNEEEESKEILLMKQRVEEMEREAKKLRELQAAAEGSASDGGQDSASTSSPMETEDDKALSDSRSIFIGNVDYAATPEEIQAHFQACGTINRVTIICDKFTGHPKGFAYVEFAEPEHVDPAIALDNSLFHGRLIKQSVQISTVSIEDEVVEEAIEEATEVASEVEAASTRTQEEASAGGKPCRPSSHHLVLTVSQGTWPRVLSWSTHTKPTAGAYSDLIITVSCAFCDFARYVYTSRSRNQLYLYTTTVMFPPRYLGAAVGAVPLARRTLATSVKYPYSSAAIIPPPAPGSPAPALREGKGLMAYLQATLPSTDKQEMLTTLFSRNHRDRLRPGSVVTVTLAHAPNTFSGVLISLRRRGPDTSFVLRNIVQRTGVEMQFFVNSPHLKEIKVVSKPSGGEGRKKKQIKKAKLFYLRDSPEKMSAVSAGVRR